MLMIYLAAIETDANKSKFETIYGFSNVSRERFVIGTGNRRILRLRNENKTVSDGIISASRTDSSSGATETVQISYVP